MTVKDLIIELLNFDQDMEVLVPCAPNGEPEPLQYVGIVDNDYIGLNLGNSWDDDSLGEEEIEAKPEIKEQEDITNPIYAENLEEFILKIDDMNKKGLL